jgi:hypothetical protein
MMAKEDAQKKSKKHVCKTMRHEQHNAKRMQNVWVVLSPVLHNEESSAA